LLRTALDPVARVPQGKIKDDPRRDIGRRRVTANLACIAFCPRRLAIQGITHGIKERGFAGASGAMDKEEMALAKLAKIQDVLVGIRSKGRQSQGKRSHAVASRSRWCSVSTMVV
jgi:hypothetical protein